MGFRIVVSPSWTFVGHLHKISAIWRSREATREVTFIFTRWDQTVFLLGQGDLVALIQHGGEGWREVSSARSRKRFQTGQNLFSIFHRVFAFRAYEIKLANFLRVERQLRTLLLIFGFKITRLVSMSASLKKNFGNYSPGMNNEIFSFLFLSTPLYLIIFLLNFNFVHHLFPSYFYFIIGSKFSQYNIVLYKHICCDARWTEENLFNTFKQ